MKVNQYSVRKSRRPALSNEATITKLGVDHKLSSEMLTNDHTSSSSQMMDVEITSKIHPSNTLEYKPSILSRYPEITVPNVYGKRLYAILAPNRSYLPEHVIYRKEMYMIDLKKLYARENMPNTAFMSHSLKRNPLMRESLAHRYVETKSWHEEQKEYKRRKLNNTWKGSNKIHQRFHKVSHSASHRHSHNGTNSRQQNGNVDKTVQSSCSWITTKDETCYSGTYSSAIPNTINGPLKSKIKTGAKSWKQYKKELETSTDPNESQSCVIATSTCQPLLNFRNATDACKQF